MIEMLVHCGFPPRDRAGLLSASMQEWTMHGINHPDS
jgi:hypothetical protein